MSDVRQWIKAGLVQTTFRGLLTFGNLPPHVLLTGGLANGDHTVLVELGVGGGTPLQWIRKA